MSIITDPDALDRADMEKLQAGHDAALNDLMARHATPVFRFLCRMTGNEDDASDLAQESDFSGAAAEYQEALRLNPGQVKTKVGLATVLLNLGREPEAVQQLDEVLIQEPGNPAALELRQQIRR